MRGRSEVQGRSWGRISVELGVIFVGVMAAFFAEDFRQGLEDAERAEHIYAALSGEIEVYLERAPYVASEMESRLEAWRTGYEAGETPPPAHYREPGAEAPPMAIWDATLASGGIGLVDPVLFNGLAEYYNALRSTADRYLRYNTFTEASVLPLLGEGPSAFYRDDGRIRAEYTVHMEALAEIAGELRRTTELGRGLAEAIEAQVR